MSLYKINNILLPIDFSNFSTSALNMAIAICKRQNANLTLLCVVNYKSIWYQVDAIISSFNLKKYTIKSSEDNLENLSKSLSLQTGITINSKIVKGNPAYSICKVASIYNYDLIILGGQEAKGLTKMFNGFDSYKVVKYATCPLLTIPLGWERTEFKKAVFPIRLLPGTLEKYEYARPIFEKNASNLFIIGIADQKSPDNIGDLSDKIESFRFRLRNDNLESSCILHFTKDFQEKVIEGAEGFNADLIVITDSIENNLKAFFIKSFAQQIISNSKRPVLCVNPSIIKMAAISSVKEAKENSHYNYFVCNTK